MEARVPRVPHVGFLALYLSTCTRPGIVFAVNKPTCEPPDPHKHEKPTGSIRLPYCAGSAGSAKAPTNGQDVKLDHTLVGRVLGWWTW
jgi:hypothetical protein